MTRKTFEEKKAELLAREVRKARRKLETMRANYTTARHNYVISLPREVQEELGKEPDGTT